MIPGISQALLLNLIGGVLVAAIAYGGYKMLRNHFIGIDNIRTELVNERNRANRAEVSLAAERLVAELREQHADKLAEVRAEAQQQINVIRDETRAEMEVLEDRERLARVTIAKPGLVEKLANRATESVFNDLEATFNQ